MILDHRTLSDNVVNIIRKMILNGNLKPGERINQAQLADKLNISRGPIREALRLLQNEGLIQHVTNKGTFVTTLSVQDAYEIYTLRALLESEAAQLAVSQLTIADFQKLEMLLNQISETMKEGDLEKQAQYDIEFHLTIVEASKHQRLINMHRQLDTQVGAMFLTVANKVPIRVNQVVKNHVILLDALKCKKKPVIKKAFSDHYMHSLEDLSKMN